MTDYIAYHSSERMGRAFDQTPRIITNKSKKPKAIIGARVWIISGTGRRTKEYRLEGTFVVDGIRPSHHGELSFEIYGPELLKCDKAQLLNRELWFKPLLRKMGNFSHGFSPIASDEIIKGLESLRI